jgi:hypothetical protein
MGIWLREWLRVGTAIALLGGLLWLVAEGDVGLPALLRSAVCGLVVWVGCGLIWIVVEYGQRHEDARERWSRIDRLDRGESGDDEPRAAETSIDMNCGGSGVKGWAAR